MDAISTMAPGTPAAPAEGVAEAAAESDFRRPFHADLRKYYRICFGTESPSAGQKALLLATHYGLQCVAIYRFDRWTRRWRARTPLAAPLVLLAAFLSHLCEFVHHVRIRATVGPGFYIGHVGTIYIGPTRIGRNFSCTHNVTVGYGQTDAAKGYPVLGDDVWVGTGAVIAGAITVGNGATIAHGAMITRSVPDHALAAGNPGRIVLQGYDNSALLCARGTAGPVAPAGPPV